MTTIEAARAYRSAGLSIIPVRPDGSKAPAVNQWAPFRDRLATDAEIDEWFGKADFTPGIAILCGKASGNLLVFDFESREAYDVWLVTAAQMAGQYGIDLRSMPISETPNGGVHLYYRSAESVCGNKKLAMDERGKTLIETRGEGGYVLAPGSPGACHPSGKPYRWINQGWLSNAG